jgi:hypothetical protein
MMFWNIAHQLLTIHAALDDALGDTDITHMPDAQLREDHPVQWAAEKLARLIKKLEQLDSPSQEK